MLDLLSDFMNRAATPEEKLMFQNAMEALDEIGHEDIEYVIEEILNTDDEVDGGSTLLTIRQLIYAHLQLVVQLHSVTLDQNTPMDVVTEIVRGMMQLDNHEDRHSLIAVTNEQAPPREVYCELLSMVTRFTVDDLLPYVIEVAESFMLRLKSNEDAEDMEDPNELENRRARIHDFKKFDIFVTPQGGVPHLTNMLRSGIDVSLPFSLYAKAMPIPFDQLNPKLIAREMFGMALVSSDGYDRPYEIIKENIEEYVASPDTVIKAMTEARQLQMGYQK